MVKGTAHLKAGRFVHDHIYAMVMNTNVKGTETLYALISSLMPIQLRKPSLLQTSNKGVARIGQIHHAIGSPTQKLDKPRFFNIP